MQHASRALVRLSAAVTLLALPAPAQTACTETGFTAASNPTVGNAYGSRIAANGGLALVQDAEGGYDAGTGQVWPTLSTLSLSGSCAWSAQTSDAALASLALPFSLLGQSMDLALDPGAGGGGSDRTVGVVGAPNVFFPGEAHRVQRDAGAGAWTAFPGFYANPTTDRSFGSSVAANADASIVAVAAPEAAGAGTFAGQVWEYDDSLVEPLPSSVSGSALGSVVFGGSVPAGAGFGTGLACDGSWILIGAPGVSSGAGRVYALERSGGPGSSWTLQQTLTPPSGSQFGAKLIASGGYLFASSDDGSGNLTHHEYLLSGGTWSPTGESLAGEALALDGDRALIGADPGQFPSTCTTEDVRPAHRATSGAWVVGVPFDNGAVEGGGLALADGAYLVGSQEEFDCCVTLFGCPIGSTGELRVLCCDAEDCDGNGVPDWIEGGAGGSGPTFSGPLLAGGPTTVCPGDTVTLTAQVSGGFQLLRWYRTNPGGGGETEIGTSTVADFDVTVDDSGAGGTFPPGDFFARLLVADNDCMVSDLQSTTVALDLVPGPVASGSYSATPAIETEMVSPGVFTDFVEVCDGEPVSITFTGGGPSYDWVHDSVDLTTAPGVTITSGAGSTTLDIASLGASLEGVVNAVSENSCGEQVVHGSIELRALPLATLAGTPPSSDTASPTCPGTTVTLTAAPGGTFELLRWYRADVGGANESEIGTSTGASFAFVLNTTGGVAPGEFFARILAADNQCAASDLESGRIELELIAAPDTAGTYSASPAIQVGAVEVCAGDPLSITLTTTGPNVTWTHSVINLSSDPNVTITNGPTSSTVDIASTSAAYEGTIFATTSNGCGASFDYASIAIQTIALPTLSPSPPSADVVSPVCPDTTVTLTAGVGGDFELLRWYRADVGGANESQIGTSVGASFAFLLSDSGGVAPGEFFARLLAAENGCLASDTESGRLVIELEDEPDATGVYSASPSIQTEERSPGVFVDFVEVCAGDAIAITLTSSGPSVTWTHSTIDLDTDPNVTITGGAGSSTLTILSASLAYEGTVFATTENTCGATNPYPPIELRTSDAPQITSETSTPAAAGSGNVELFQYGGAVFSVTATGDDLAYQWSLNASPLVGETTDTLEIDEFATAGLQTVSVEVSSPLCPSANATFTVDVDDSQIASSIWTSPGTPSDLDNEFGEAGNWDTVLAPKGHAVVANAAGSPVNEADVTDARSIQLLTVSSPSPNTQRVRLLGGGTLTVAQDSTVSSGGELAFAGGDLESSVTLGAGALATGAGSLDGPLTIEGPDCTGVETDCVSEQAGDTYGVVAPTGTLTHGGGQIQNAGRIELADSTALVAPGGVQNTEGANDTLTGTLSPRGVRLSGGTLTVGASQGTGLGDCPPATGVELTNGERGDVRGFGLIQGDVRHAGRLVSQPTIATGSGGITVTGRLDAEGGLVPQAGWSIDVEIGSTLTVGNLDTTCGAGVLTMAASDSTVSSVADAVLGDGTWYLPGAGTLEAGGDVSFRGTDSKHFDAVASTLRLEGTGASALQLLELPGVELGTVADLSAPALNAFDTVEIGPSPTSVQLTDAFSNTGTGTETLYADRLIVRAGSTLTLAGFDLHVNDLELESGATLDVTGGTLFYVTSTPADPCDGSATVIGDDGDCTTGTGLALAPAADCDANGTPDATDIGLGNVPDCNGNGIPDACDLLAGTSLDQDGDSVPDDCQQFWVDCEEISLTVGGTQTLSLDAGSAQGGQFFLILGSATGTSPPIPFGTLLIPIVFDTYTNLTVNNANGAFLSPGLGLLDGSGQGSSAFSIPGGVLGAQFVGVEVYHAFITISLLSEVTSVSNPVFARFTP